MRDNFADDLEPGQATALVLLLSAMIALNLMDRQLLAMVVPQLLATFHFWRAARTLDDDLID